MHRGNWDLKLKANDCLYSKAMTTASCVPKLKMQNLGEKIEIYGLASSGSATSELNRINICDFCVQIYDAKPIRQKS